MVNLRARESNRVQEKFKAAIQDFQLSERDFRAKYTERVERRFKLVRLTTYSCYWLPR